MKSLLLVMAFTFCGAGCAAQKTSTLQPAERPPVSPGTRTDTSAETVPATAREPEAAAPREAPFLSPATTGSITATADRNQNTTLHVKLDHLPPPANLHPGLTTYVVWIRPRSGSDYRNAGQLLMSEERQGELLSTTPFSDVEVIVTAEESATKTAPGKFVVLRGAASRP